MKANSISKERQGELFIFFGALVWGLFPVITVLSFSNITTLVALSLSTIFAAIFFGIIIVLRKKLHELHNTSALFDIVCLAGFITTYYLLYFFGLRFTSPGNASIISLTEIFFAFMLFNVWKGDHMPKGQIFGAILVVIGAIIVLYPNFKTLQIGDLLILGCAMVAPLGNFFQRRARTKVSSETIMFVRSLIGGTALLAFVFLFHAESSLLDIKNALPYLLINGVLLLGASKVLWIEGIHRINVTKAVGIQSITPFATLLFAFILLHKNPTMWQLLSIIPMAAGIILMGKTTRQETTSQSE